MPKTLIYEPRLDPFRPISAVSTPVEATSSPIRFPRPLNRGITTKKPGTLETVETKGDWLNPGTNLNISDEDYEFISKHWFGVQLINSGALKTVEPVLEEGAIATGTTRDYSEKDALELVRNSNDLEWLELSERKEERPVITKALLDRTKAIKALQSRG